MAGLELLYTSVSGQLTSRQDAVILSVHWAVVRAGLKCIGTGDTPPSDVSTVRKSEMLPAEWNASSDVYTIQYATDDSRVYLLKAIRMENVLLTHFMRVSDESEADMMIDVTQYTSEDLSSFQSAYKNIEELQTKFTKDVLDKVLKSKTSTGVGSTTTTDQSRSSDQRRRDPLMEDDPLRVGPPRRPGARQPPEWADPGDPFSIGRGDLDPLAGGVGGGMMFDPMRSGFPGRGRDPNTGLPGPGRLPPGAVPPGARFDPFGPPNPDRSGAPFGGRGPAGPDPDHLPPPGYDDMYM